MFGDLSLDQKKDRDEKVNKFLDFIYYDWGEDCSGLSI
jgi:hypothetical protein